MVRHAHHKLTIDILTLFPNMFTARPVDRSSGKRKRNEERFYGGPFDESIIKRGKDKGLVEINFHNIRDFAIDDYGTVDDRPYGGGVGMVMRPEPIVAALRQLGSKGQAASSRGKQKATKTPGMVAERSEDSSQVEESGKRSVTLLSASGKLFNQQKAQELSKLDHLILICGHYEGVDQRIADHYCDEELSIGDYVLTGGEIPAMVIVDSVVRLIPGVLVKEEATQLESFSASKGVPLQSKGTPLQLVESPHYTRPEEFADHKVPEVLLSGNHASIAKWREEEAIKRTKKNRPDLLHE